MELNRSQRRRLLNLIDREVGGGGRFEKLEDEVGDLRRSVSRLIEEVTRLRVDRTSIST